MKRCLVPYERLDISCNAESVNGEDIQNLFDEQEYKGPSEAISKWQSNLSKGGKSLNITISVKDEYPPIILTHYALKSADGAPDRDPKHWKLFYFDEEDRFVPNHIHEQKDVAEQWNGRWQWREWKIENRIPSRKFLLRIIST